MLLIDNKTNVAALIPAHNEAECILAAIDNLQRQTVGCDVFVVCDNCCDNTKSLAESKGVAVIETIANTHKKSGALNQALSQILEKYDFVLVQDADTTVSANLIQLGLDKLQQDYQLGAVCSKAGIKNISTTSWLEELLWRLQRIEYATFDSSRIETRNVIKVVHGMAAIYRSKALKTVMARWGRIYDEHNITEDYELTVCLKELGWKVTANLDMKAWTEVPTTFKELWTQRVRWFRGGVDVLRAHGLNNITAHEFIQHFLFMVLTAINAIIITTLGYSIYSGRSMQIQPLFYWVIAVTTLDGLYRLRYVENLHAKDVLIRLLVLPFSLYMLIYQAEQLWAYWLSITKTNQEW